ncbi:MAG TPA: acyl-CoA dehydrogenase family protein, partial [Burkholderiaceae bacterium]|nr:acyl-CoA dehydrogenase family protein [Burkholderiaceae bacterium]
MNVHELPFFDDAHRAQARELDAWTQRQAIDHGATRDETDRACRAWVRRLGDAGVLRACVPGAFGGARDALDSRALVVARETLAYHDGLADFAFAMQGLGSGAITLAGSAELQRAWLPKVARGEAIAAFALSEPEAGSDVGALQCAAREQADAWVLDGQKTWISNGGIADFYCVFARSGGEGTRGISAFFVPADTPGLAVAERIDVIAPHPLARLAFTGCRVPKAHQLGASGDGFKLAMRVLDIFRASVAAAALGFARRALDEAVAWS